MAMNTEALHICTLETAFGEAIEISIHRDGEIQWYIAEWPDGAEVEYDTLTAAVKDTEELMAYA